MNMLRDMATERGMGTLLVMSPGHMPGGRQVLRDTRELPLHPDQMAYVGRLCGEFMGDGYGGGQVRAEQYKLDSGTMGHTPHQPHELSMWEKDMLDKRVPGHDNPYDGGSPL